MILVVILKMGLFASKHYVFWHVINDIQITRIAEKH
jgi:hypothetical protein